MFLFLKWALLLLVLVVLRSFIKQTLIKRSFAKFGIKSPFSLPLLGNALQVLHYGGLNGALNMTEDLHRQYGETFLAFAYDSPVLQVSNPESMKVILGSKYSIYDRSVAEQDKLDQLLGGGLILESNGEKWRRTRQILMNGFHQTRLSEAVETFGSKAQKFMTTIKANQRFDVQDSFEILTFDFMCFFSLGVDLGDSEISFEGKSIPKVWYELLNHSQARFLSPFKYWNYFQTPAVKNFDRQLNFLKGLVHRAIQAERKAIEEGTQTKAQKSLLSYMVSHHLTDPEGLTIEDIVRNSITFLFAGHDTTTNLLTFMFYHIGLDEKIKAKCFEEVDSIFAGQPLDYVPNINELKQLRYLKMITKETLRMYPGAPIRGRTLLEDDELSGMKLPAKIWLSVDWYSAHMNPRYWPEPEKFDPERFTEEREAERPAHYWLPFGAGARRCIGEQLALLEALCVATMILRRFDPVSDRTQVIEKEMTLTMRSKHAVWMEWKSRA